MEEALYIGKTEEDVEAFIDMFACGEDPKKEKRMAYRRTEFFLPEEGTVGKYIAEQMLAELTQEEQVRARRIMGNG